MTRADGDALHGALADPQVSPGGASIVWVFDFTTSEEELARLHAKHDPNSSLVDDRAALLKRIRQLEADNERMRELLTNPARKP